MSFIKEHKRDFILLLEAGFIAVNQADEPSAKRLFKAAAILNPKSTLPKVGTGYLHLHKLELKQACELFENVLKEEPNNEMAKAFLGLSLSFTPKGVLKAEQILENTAKSRDSLIHNLSVSALDFIDKFVKKEPSPYETTKPKNK
jgi:hypothetical protein